MDMAIRRGPLNTTQYGKTRSPPILYANFRPHRSVQYIEVQCSAYMQSSLVQASAVQCKTVQCNTVQCIHQFTKPPILHESRLTGCGSPNLVDLIERKVPVEWEMGADTSFH